jgi:hypothetical protein
VTLSVNGAAGQIFSVTAGSAGWLTVNPLSGVLPAALSVAVNRPVSPPERIRA